MVCRAADRLSHLCVALKLTTAEFAQRLDLPKGRRLPRRPNHIFLEKVLAAFPTVSPCWLLLGKGNMFRSTYTTTNTANNYVGINHGQCFQYITISSTDSVLEQQLRANLDDKERMIQILIHRLGYSGGEINAHSHSAT
jgi:hypothetical protein